MAKWHCDACGQRIDNARVGWLSICLQDGRATVLLVHHNNASPWFAWGGCAPADEVASLHLSDALRDARALDSLVASELLGAEQAAALQRRLCGASTRHLQDDLSAVATGADPSVRTGLSTRVAV